MSAHAVSPNKLRGEADAYEFLERLTWGVDGPQVCPHCESDKGAWFLQSKDPAGRKSKGGSASRSQRRVWKCRESSCRRQFSVLTNTVMQGTKLPIQVWLEVVYALCTEDDGLSASDVAKRWGIAEKSALLVLERIQHALETPESAGANLASNAPLWVRLSVIETTGQRAAAARARGTDPAHVDRLPADLVEKRVVVDLTAAEPVVDLGTAPPQPSSPEPAAAAIVEPVDPSAKVVDAASPEPSPVVAATETEVAPIAPRIDRDQVESDVQRVLAELVESEGLFADGWLDANPRPADTSLGPAWTAADDEDAAAMTHVSAHQLGLFSHGEEE